jgi:hypothetical protein
MFGFAAAAGADNLGFPVCGCAVKPAKCFSALGDGRPRRVGSGDMSYQAAWGERNVTTLCSLSLRHAETTRLLGRGV